MTLVAAGADEVWVPSPESLPRLLPAAGREDLAAHLERLGPLPSPPEKRPASAMAQLLEAADLVSRGGAAFPTAGWLRTVAESGRAPVVVVNAVEGEPAGGKDRAVLTIAPHLVLDGAELVASVLGAQRVLLCLAETPSAGEVPGVPWSTEAAVASLLAACAERNGGPVVFEVRRVPHRYLSGDGSALARWLDGGPALPTDRRVPLARRGVGRRPTALDGAETFAQVALIARFGPGWYRGVGHAEDPGTTLVSVTGAVQRPGVAEIPVGAALGALVEAMGGLTEPFGAGLVGGYRGSWVSGPGSLALPLLLRPTHTPTPLRSGVVSVLPASACGVSETARLARYMAEESAGQCGPCVNGVPAVAGALGRLARPASADDASLALSQLERWCGQLAGRGACDHPDGVVRLVRSALTAFAGDVERHRQGRACAGADREPVLPLPGGAP